MASAVWLLDYGVMDDALETYLDWFHRVHVADKLARPGYTWAAHYQVCEPRSQTGCTRFIGMFGGESPRVFLDPSPAQLKLRQSGETKEMMGLRVDGRSTVYSEEWESQAGGHSMRPTRNISCPVLRLQRYDANGHDEDFASWCAQEHMLHFSAGDGCRASRKLIASAGGPRHAIMHEFDSTDAANEIVAGEPMTQWRQRIDAQVAQPLGFALLAQRIWPETEHG